MRLLSIKSAMLTRSLTALAAIAAIGFAPAAQAFDRYDAQRLWDKPMVKQAAIGAAAGVAAGALSDRVGIGKGVLTGTIVGAGTGYMSQNDTLSRKPLVRRILQGATIGAGTGYATNMGVLKGGLIGAAGGAGYHIIKDKFF